MSPLDLKTFKGMLLGDLIFFGTKECCTHVGIYRGSFTYWHSSGSSHGLNGIGINVLGDSDPISAHYLESVRSVGRITSCHTGVSVP